MTTLMKSNDDVCSASVDGVTYEPNEEGVFTVHDGRHASILAGPPYNFETLGQGEAAPAAEPESETEEARAAREADELTAKIEALKAVDPTTMTNRGIVVKWLSAHGDEDSKSSEDRDALNEKVIALRDKLVAELEDPAPAE